MKRQRVGTRRRGLIPGNDPALSLQEELVAAIHAAFDVAVQLVVSDVKKLLSQTTGGDMYEDMRRENVSLRQRLQRAEAMMDSAWLQQGGGDSPTLPSPTEPSFPVTQNLKLCPPEVSCEGLSSEAPPACRSRSQQQPVDAQQDVQGSEETVEMSRLCTVKTESDKQPCQDSTAHLTSLQTNHDVKYPSEQVTVKQERREEEEEKEEGRAVLASSSDLVKVEEFSPESVSEWEPDVTCTQSQDVNTRLLFSGVQDPLTHSPEIPTLQLETAAPVPEAPSQRNSRYVSNVHVCKLCGQTFHLPSLLRRHYCPQKIQQLLQPSAPGKRMNRLQLYPPGTSSFPCPECNREFNRLVNLKTHLRIHTGERPFRCTVCSKCFRHSCALTRHLRIHTGEKPYVCGQCGESFMDLGRLKLHRRSHAKPLQ